MPEQESVHQRDATTAIEAPTRPAEQRTRGDSGPIIPVSGLAHSRGLNPERLSRAPAQRDTRPNLDALRRIQRPEMHVIRRKIPTDKSWKDKSSRVGKRRSAALKQVDAALAAWNTLPDDATQPARLAALSALTEAIETWKDTKVTMLGEKEDSCRLEDMESLEDEVEKKRLKLEAVERGDVEETPLEDRYEHVAVLTQAATVDDSGEFIGDSANDYQNAKMSLQQDNRPSTEADIRIEMLTQRLREAHDTMSDEIEDFGEKHVVGLFTAPEWYFKRPRRPFSPSDKEKIINTFLAFSATHPGMIIVPGSIVWSEGRGGQTTIRNTTVAVANGQLLKLINKRAEGGDVVGYSPMPDERDLYGKSRRKRAYKAVEKRKKDWNRSGKTDEDSLFTVANLTVSLEICADHNNKRAFNDIVEQDHPGVHLQIIVTHSASPGASALRKGGVAVWNDAVLYKDKPPKRQVLGAPDAEEDDEIGRVPPSFRRPKQGRDQIMFHDEQSLAKQFMGIYHLPK